MPSERPSGVGDLAGRTPDPQDALPLPASGRTLCELPPSPSPPHPNPPADVCLRVQLPPFPGRQPFRSARWGCARRLVTPQPAHRAVGRLQSPRQRGHPRATGRRGALPPSLEV